MLKCTFNYGLKATFKYHVKQHQNKLVLLFSNWYYCFYIYYYCLTYKAKMPGEFTQRFIYLPC